LEAIITKAGVGGDRQQNLKVHGGPDRAICLYSQELIERLQDEGHSIEAGSSGENLTFAGLEWEKLTPGDQIQIGPEVRIEVMSYTSPCDKNAQWFRERDYTRVSQKLNPGWSRLYAKVLREGVVRPGDEVVVKPGERVA
jgi:MOSC domain-containing protein YiiM